MSTQPRARLVQSVPYWALVAVSVLTVAGGLALTLPRIGEMETKLLDGTATGVEVYVGQAWVSIGAGLIAAGALGILLALALGAASALVRPQAAVVEQIAWDAEDEPEWTADEPATTAGEPLVQTTGADVERPTTPTSTAPAADGTPAAAPGTDDAERPDTTRPGA